MIRPRLFGLAFAVIGCCGFGLLAYAQGPEKAFHKPPKVLDVVKTQAGMIQGLPPNTAGIRIYKGVAFAMPPVGDRRWRAPAQLEPWEGVRPATQFSTDCVQAPPADGHSVSEDCLYLNIWTGAQTIAERRPVLVWIHGGGFSSGSGRDVRINGENLAKRGIVVVTINYRVGALGFPRPSRAHAGVSQQDVGKLRVAGSACGVSVGPAQYLDVRRRSGKRDAGRQLGRRTVREHAGGVTAGQESFQAGYCRERRRRQQLFACLSPAVEGL